MMISLTSTFAFIFFGSSSILASQQSVYVQHSSHNRHRAHRVAIEVIDKFQQRRHLFDDLPSAENFKQYICDPFISGFMYQAPNAQCNCDSEYIEVACMLPKACERVKGCNREVCAEDAVNTKFMPDLGGVDSIELNIRYISGADIDAQRSTVSSSSCEEYISVNGTEHRCEECFVCAETGEIMVDCSNIQDGAMQECGNDVDALLDFCLPLNSWLTSLPGMG